MIIAIVIQLSMRGTRFGQLAFALGRTANGAKEATIYWIRTEPPLKSSSTLERQRRAYGAGRRSCIVHRVGCLGPPITFVRLTSILYAVWLCTCWTDLVIEKQRNLV